MTISGSPKEIIRTELHKYKHGQLHSGAHQGPLVKNRKQAIAIALSEARKGRAVGGGLGSSFFQPMSARDNPFPALSLPLEQMIGQYGGGFGGGLGGGMPGATPPIASSIASPSAGPTASGQSPIIPQTMAPPVATPAAPGVPGPGGVMNPAGSWAPRAFQFGGGMTRAPAPSWMVRGEARNMLHSGPISSIVPGRTDRHNVSVGSGSYVMPADAVSHLGQNNTKAGQAILSHMFSAQGPYGAGKDMPVRHGPGAPKAPGLSKQPGALKLPNLQSAGGGKGDRSGEPVPIVVAGGEFTIPPAAVAAVGGGDIKRGHRVLDQWVMSLRKKHIATLKGLPPPAKS